MNQLHLACRGCRLQVLEPGTPLVDPEHGASDGNRTGRYYQQLVTAPMVFRDIVGEAGKPLPVDPPVSADQKR